VDKNRQAFDDPRALEIFEEDRYSVQPCDHSFEVEVPRHLRMVDVGMWEGFVRTYIRYPNNLLPPLNNLLTYLRMVDVGGFCEDVVRRACAPVCELLPIRPQEYLNNEGEGGSGREEEGGR
jgi:hypothetical protein